MFIKFGICKLKEMGRIKYSCNLSILKSDETPKCFKALTLLAPMSHVVAINFQYFIVTSIKNLHQEINKHLTFSASIHQVVSKWLLPLVI